jgi:signal transduction histidine kinase
MPSTIRKATISAIANLFSISSVPEFHCDDLAALDVTLTVAGLKAAGGARGYGRPRQLRNLIENAIAHATARSEVMVATTADGSISVTDRGPGVPEADRERIFERFWRAKGAASPGASSGPAIVAEIMKAHGGSVRVESSTGGGAVFTLAFRGSAPQGR